MEIWARWRREVEVRLRCILGQDCRMFRIDRRGVIGGRRLFAGLVEDLEAEAEGDN